MPKNPIVTEKPRRAYIRHLYSEKVRVVNLYLSGLGSKRIARETGLDDSLIRLWLRRYKTGGMEALSSERSARKENSTSTRLENREKKNEQFKDALIVFATTLEPVASITRRYKLDYRGFMYHVERHRPDLMLRRESLKTMND